MINSSVSPSMSFVGHQGIIGKVLQYLLIAFFAMFIIFAVFMFSGIWFHNLAVSIIKLDLPVFVDESSFHFLIVVALISLPFVSIVQLNVVIHSTSQSCHKPHSKV